jgi:predicted DNA-binding transcriptional regulator AlpA
MRAAKSAVPSQAELLAKQYLEEAEICALLSITERTLENWYMKRVGPPRVKIGRRIFYRVSSVLKWLNAHEQGQATGNAVSR